MADEEAASRADVEHFVEESRERERRIRKAVAALEGVPLGAGGRPKAAPAPKVAAKGGRPQPVSMDVADAVLAKARELMAASGKDTFSRPELVKAMPGKSGETIRRGLLLLRDQERIRLAGKGKGAGRSQTATNLYALMPNGN